MRDAIVPTLNETERASVDYVTFLADKVGAYQAPPPIGSSEFGDHLGLTTDQLAFGQLSIAEAAQNWSSRAAAPCCAGDDGRRFRSLRGCR